MRKMDGERERERHNKKPFVHTYRTHRTILNCMCWSHLHYNYSATTVLVSASPKIIVFVPVTPYLYLVYLNEPTIHVPTVPENTFLLL